METLTRVFISTTNTHTIEKHWKFQLENGKRGRCFSLENLFLIYKQTSTQTHTDTDTTAQASKQALVAST